MPRTNLLPLLGLLLACDLANDGDDSRDRGTRTCPSSSLPGDCDPGTSSDGGSSEDSTGHGESGCDESEDDERCDLCGAPAQRG